MAYLNIYAISSEIVWGGGGFLFDFRRQVFEMVLHRYVSHPIGRTCTIGVVPLV